MKRISLAAARRNSGKNQIDVCKDLSLVGHKITVMTLSNYETGKSIPNMKTYYALCDYFGFDRGDIFLPFETPESCEEQNDYSEKHR